MVNVQLKCPTLVYVSNSAILTITGLYNYGLSNSPNCDQCNVPETPSHYFMECTKYANIRNDMITRIRDILPTANRAGRIPLSILLHGKNELSYNENIEIFDIVHSFIRRSGRNP